MQEYRFLHNAESDSILQHRYTSLIPSYRYMELTDLSVSSLQLTDGWKTFT